MYNLYYPHYIILIVKKGIKRLMKMVNQYEFGTSDVLIVEEKLIPPIEDG